MELTTNEYNKKDAKQSENIAHSNDPVSSSIIINALNLCLYNSSLNISLQFI